MRHHDDHGVWLAIHEVYYSESGEPHGWADEITPYSDEGLDGLRWVLEQMIKALDKPILEYKEEK